MLLSDAILLGCSDSHKVPFHFYTDDGGMCLMGAALHGVGKLSRAQAGAYLNIRTCYSLWPWLTFAILKSDLKAFGLDSKTWKLYGEFLIRYNLRCDAYNFFVYLNNCTELSREKIAEMVMIMEKHWGEKAEQEEENEPEFVTVNS